MCFGCWLIGDVLEGFGVWVDGVLDVGWVLLVGLEEFALGVELVEAAVADACPAEDVALGVGGVDVAPGFGDGEGFVGEGEGLWAVEEVVEEEVGEEGEVEVFELVAFALGEFFWWVVEVVLAVGFLCECEEVEGVLEGLFEGCGGGVWEVGEEFFGDFLVGDEECGVVADVLDGLLDLLLGVGVVWWEGLFDGLLEFGLDFLEGVGGLCGDVWLGVVLEFAPGDLEWGEFGGGVGEVGDESGGELVAEEFDAEVVFFAGESAGECEPAEVVGGWEAEVWVGGLVGDFLEAALVVVEALFVGEHVVAEDGWGGPCEAVGGEEADVDAVGLEAWLGFPCGVPLDGDFGL